MYCGGCGLGLVGTGRLSAQRRDKGRHDDGECRATTIFSTPRWFTTAFRNATRTSYGRTSPARCPAITRHATASLSNGSRSVRTGCATSKPAGRNDGWNAARNQWSYNKRDGSSALESCFVSAAATAAATAAAAAAAATTNGLYVQTRHSNANSVILRSWLTIHYSCK